MRIARTNRATSVPMIAIAAIPTPTLAALALVIAAAFWGTAFAAAKVVLFELPPTTVAVLRLAIATVVLIPLACRGGVRPAFGLQPVLLGLTTVTIFLTQNAGLRHTSAAHATLILGGGMPVLMAIFGACWLGERPPRRQLAGLACSLLGVVAVAGVSRQTHSSLWGDGLLVLTAASGAAYAVLGRRSFAGRNALAVLVGSTLWATLLLVPPAAIELSQTELAWPSARVMLLLLYLGVCCSALAFALWTYALRHLTAAQNAVVGTVELPIGLAAAALLVGEVLSPAHVLAGALVVTGTILAIKRTSIASPPTPSRAAPPVLARRGVRFRLPRRTGDLDPRVVRPHAAVGSVVAPESLVAVPVVADRRRTVMGEEAAGINLEAGTNRAWLDRFARRLAASEMTRRGLAWFVAGAALAGLALRPEEATAACKAPKQKCRKGKQCCSGTCKKGKCATCADGAHLIGGATPVCWLTWGKDGSGRREFVFPSGVAVSRTGKVYVADWGNHRVQQFTAAGAFVRKWGSEGSGPTEFSFPAGIAVAGAGQVSVADTGNNRVLTFTGTGTPLKTEGTAGNGDGQFDGPNGVALGGSGHLYVADTFNHRIQEFDAAGTFVRQWGGNGAGNGQFDRPYGVAADGAGKLYVSDTSNNRVQVFDTTKAVDDPGFFVGKWGGAGSGDGQFAGPIGVAVGGTGQVYVGDEGNHRVQEFTATGDFVRTWGSLGSGVGQLDRPSGVAVGATGDVYIADTKNDRIARLRPM